ncbi:MAG TPA: glycosyltransferase family 4 protein [Azospirillaceae bacterium]|nr:glycosyltransferase family 4 protein [Azospirillaceae bacterium]
MGANAAIYFHPEGYDTSAPKLMGRHAAGEGFLRGFLRHADVDRFFCLSRTQALAQPFADNVARLAPGKPVIWIPAEAPEQIAAAGCIYTPGPGLAEEAFRRRASGQRAYSICGVTHTTASFTALDSIADMLTAPVQPWDALICTSRVVLDTVRRLLDDQADYLADRLGATRFPTPLLPVIPLGVDCGALAPDAAARASWRERLGIAAEDVAVLFMGRLSFHAKAHPIPMYQALERAARSTGRRIHLIQSGWFANEFIEAAFKNEAANHAPGVVHHWLDGRKPDVRGGIWSAVDVFVSLSDNIQETFGLTPIEAMAAGLPVVVSDWDGYKDTVRDGVDGFRIPTLMAGEGLGADLMRRHELDIDTYDVYCGRTSQFVAIDVAACAAAFERLILDPGLRASMGAAGRARALERYDWRVVIGQYQALWAEQERIRAAGAESAPRKPGRPGRPARPDPYRSFATYPTRTLDLGTLFVARPGAGAAEVTALLNSPMVQYLNASLPAPDELAALLAAASVPLRVETLLAAFPEQRRGHLARGLVWLAKFDLGAFPTA